VPWVITDFSVVGQQHHKENFEEDAFIFKQINLMMMIDGAVPGVSHVKEIM